MTADHSVPPTRRLNIEIKVIEETHFVVHVYADGKEMHHGGCYLSASDAAVVADKLARDFEGPWWLSKT